MDFLSVQNGTVILQENNVEDYGEKKNIYLKQKYFFMAIFLKVQYKSVSQTNKQQRL